MALKIYDWHNGPYPARIRIALAEKGLQSCVRFVSVDLRKGGLYQRDKALWGMRYFDDLLRAQPFVAGEDFSMADIALTCGMIFAAMLKVPVPAECSALVAWFARMRERPSVQNWRTMSD